jgi:hypothetical protein
MHFNIATQRKKLTALFASVVNECIQRQHHYSPYFLIF